MVLSANKIELFKMCVDSYQHGLSIPAPVLNLNEKYNIKFLAEMFMRVSVRETMAILQASQVRAQAIALSRSGEIDQAHNALKQAELISSHVGLSREARMANSDYQNAAKAYVEYKMQDYRKAESSLRTALKCCRTLRDQYHYVVDVHRITLARHLIRVKSSAGRREDAFALACLLVRYIEGEAECWPFSDLRLTTPNDLLSTEDQSSLLDQTLSDISWLLTTEGEKRQHLIQLDWALFTEPVHTGSGVSRARLRLSAMRAIVEGDQVGFLEKAIRFFRDGPGYMPQAWQEMSREFVQMFGDAASKALA